MANEEWSDANIGGCCSGTGPGGQSIADTSDSNDPNDPVVVTSDGSRIHTNVRSPDELVGK
ncbi:MAG: hypothetical protein WAV15_04415 [Minisyncoccia bacterium]